MINLASFRASRCPPLHKPVSWFGLFLSFLTANWLQYKSPFPLFSSLLFRPVCTFSIFASESRKNYPIFYAMHDTQQTLHDSQLGEIILISNLIFCFYILETNFSIFDNPHFSFLIHIELSNDLRKIYVVNLKKRMHQKMSYTGEFES